MGKFQTNWLSLSKRLITLCFLLILWQKSYSQYFNKAYDLATNYTDLFNSSILLPDSNIFTQGFDVKLDGSYGITFTKLNQYNGDTIWHKKYGTSGDKYARANGRPHTLYDNFIYTTANYYDTSGNSLPVLFKLNLNGNIIWEKHFIDTVQDFWILHSISVTNDGNFIFAGCKKITATNYNFNLVKTDTSGNIIWEKFFGNSSTEIAMTVDTTFDGGFYLAGYRETSATTVDGYIVKTDSNGNLQWQKLMNNSTNVWGRTLSNGNLLVYGGKENPTPSETDAYIAIVDDTTNTLIDEKYFILSDSSYNIFFDAVEVQGNLYFTGGALWHDVNNISGAFFKSNLQLDSLIFRTYSVVPSENGLYSIIPTADGGFIMTGFVAPSISMGTTQDGWIVRVDSTGCESLSCVLSVDETTEEKDGMDMNVYPNPANSFVTLEFESNNGHTVTIYNSYGELVSQTENAISGKQINLNGFTNGIYLITIRDEGKILGQKKLIISK